MSQNAETSCIMLIIYYKCVTIMGIMVHNIVIIYSHIEILLSKATYIITLSKHFETPTQWFLYSYHILICNYLDFTTKNFGYLMF